MMIAGKISAILNPVSFMIMNLAIVAIIWFGGLRINSGSLTQGELTAFVNYITQISLTLVVFANLLVIFTKAIASANRINEVFDCKPDICSGKIDNINKNDYKNSIEFKNVSFTYNGAGDKSLENISFEIKKGDMLGIIGGTGSGKSTLVNLIPRFYDATQGEIVICGENVKNYDTDTLRKSIGVVPQKAVLFTGTVRENMKWAKADADDEEIITALKTAQAWEFVEKLPQKLDTPISQGGKNLSGGQKQRLSIARAFVGKPEIIILDDSTSALDYSTDLAFRHAIREQMKDTTIVMVSQRATSLKDADKIIVMDDGKIVGMGKHSELLENCHVYSEIYNSQLSNKEENEDA